MSFARHRSRGFSLLETVIAIGVLAVLLGAFLVVFGPATASIRRAISTQEADRLATTLVSELSGLREGPQKAKYPNGFDKGFNWIKDSTASDTALLVYQYRADPGQAPRTDGSMEPYTGTQGTAGKDYVVQAMMRQRDDTLLEADLQALEGRVFAVKATQLVLVQDGGSFGFKAGQPGEIKDPLPPPAGTGATVSTASAYPGATLSFAAEFYDVPSTAPAYLKSGGAFDLTKLKSPLFTRNLAVNR